MSDPLLPLVITAMRLSTPYAPEAPPIHEHAVSFSLPALDGLRGVQAQFEQFYPAHRMSLAVSAQYRETAIGDYTSLRGGIGFEVRWYWRADAWLSRQPAGSMVGWFFGARADVLVERTHDDYDDRYLGSTLEMGLAGRVGYRIAPWRALEVTPSLVLTEIVDVALSGRVPAWARPGIGFGLTVGWMF
ncbi:MAG TPA: hypothetical protein VGM39_19435 [Kofleriaceae bacterium]|jgi:hypothetical protein